MTAPPIDFVPPGQSLQRMRRTEREFTDQHGRRWFAWADIASNAPIGEFQPMGFDPPWRPAMRYAQFRKDGDLHFVWQYETLAAELSEMATAYYNEVIQFGTDKDKDEWVPEMGGTVHPRMRNMFGKPPLSPMIPLACDKGEPWMLGVPGAPKNEILWEILTQGTQSNNRAALDAIRETLANRLAGIRTVPNVAQPVDTSHKAVKTIHTLDEGALDALVHVSYKEFVKQCGGKGMKLAEIASLWKEHKAQMAGAA